MKQKKLMPSKYRNLIEASLDPTFIIGTNGIITDANTAVEKITGLPRKILIGTVFSEYFTEPKKAEKSYIKALKDGKLFELELNLKHIDGYATPVLYNTTVYKDEEGEIVGVFGKIRDISNVKKIEEELERLKSSHKVSVELKAKEMVAVNKEFVHQAVDKADRAAELVIANKELAFQNEEKDKRAAELVIANKELAFQNEEKEKRAAELYSANKRLVKQKKMIEVLNDQLEHRVKERTAQLESANNELEALSYSISHDLNAPLRHITGYYELLNKKYNDLLPEEGRRYLENILSASNNMAELIDGLLQFSRTGRIEINKSVVNMNDIIDAYIQPVMQEDIEHRIEFNINPMPFVYADLEMMKSVWANLIENAIKYTKNKDVAKITIGADETESDITFYIKDNGAGFDMNYTSKLFAVFQRLHSREEYEGTGIGLATVQRVITRHGGKIWAEGKVGKGAAFYFTLMQRKLSE